jgi:hypothetical protein
MRVGCAAGARGGGAMPIRSSSEMKMERERRGFIL